MLPFAIQSKTAKTEFDSNLLAMARLLYDVVDLTVGINTDLIVISTRSGRPIVTQDWLAVGKVHFGYLVGLGKVFFRKTPFFVHPLR